MHQCLKMIVQNKGLVCLVCGSDKYIYSDVILMSDHLGLFVPAKQIQSLLFCHFENILNNQVSHMN